MGHSQLIKSALQFTNVIRTVRCLSGGGPYGRTVHHHRYLTTTRRQQSEGTIFEISNGVGGAEAMLFADEMLQIYMKYFSLMRWSYSLLECDKSEIGARRAAKLLVHGPTAYQDLIQEAGVHRVQRIPKTERQGRMHTSTITVSVTPKSVVDIKLNEKDIEMQTMRATGPGGQFVNKTESAVRLRHKPSGVAVESQESRHQIENRKIAMQKLLAKLQTMELDKLTDRASSMRRTQVGHADRNEKIRTYNFPQDRITDHRLSKSYHNLRGLFDGDVTILQKIINDLNDFRDRNKPANFASATGDRPDLG
uniref:Peptide chain release factor 1-like, mitochondrial n=1 Tax=Aceria tosichella TaxID=561515 RepID=A0A6G1S2Z7_9ACAR